MNDLEVGLLMFGIAVTCYYIGRYRKQYRHKAIVTELNKEWTRVNNLTTVQRDNLIMKEYRQRKALEFYADAANWITNAVQDDSGDTARVALGDVRVTKQQVAA